MEKLRQEEGAEELQALKILIRKMRAMLYNMGLGFKDALKITCLVLCPVLQVINLVWASLT